MDGARTITAHDPAAGAGQGDGIVDTGGLTPELAGATSDMLAVQDFPRMVNAKVTYQVVRDGRLVAAAARASSTSPDAGAATLTPSD